MPKRDCTGGLSRILPQILLACLLGPATAGAAELPAGGSDDHAATTQGATLTLRMLAPDETGHVRAALDIDLEPGWKTYWTQPGPVGLAPTFDFSESRGLDAAAVRTPPPEWFREGEDRSAGYAAPVAFAIAAEATASDPILRVQTLIGLCRDICVPFAASLEARPSDGLSARAAVNAAFAALPGVEAVPAGWRAEWTPERTSLRVTLPRNEAADDASVFVNGPAGWSFGAPSRVAQTASAILFDVPVLKQAAGEPLRIDVLLTSGPGARSFRALPVLIP